MSKDKNKSALLVVIAVLVFCVGSFIGVSAVINSSDNTPVPKTTLTPTNHNSDAGNNVPAGDDASDITTDDLPAIIVSDPTDNTTSEPSSESSSQPSSEPSSEPSSQPSSEPSSQPSSKPSSQPSSKPSSQPSTGGTISPDADNGAIFDNGLGGYQYDPEGNYYYTSSDPWQRYGGYNELYDLGAPFVGIYMDTVRMKFEYGDKDWMIQLWKGQYGYLFVGHEVGVYTKPKDRTVDHYDAASNEDALFMALTGYRKGEEIYTREYGKYWWCTGFVPGRLDSFADRSELSMSCRITAKDYKMLVAICGALKESGFVLGENFTTSGLDIYITW
ncbi:MAG: DUF4474 domain-containing protein [Clostridia bacterium]|nr:DUF4474 domain-containing protein [Clostridia bacterium]